MKYISGCWVWSQVACLGSLYWNAVVTVILEYSRCFGVVLRIAGKRE